MLFLNQRKDGLRRNESKRTNLVSDPGPLDLELDALPAAQCGCRLVVPPCVGPGKTELETYYTGL